MVNKLFLKFKIFSTQCYNTLLLYNDKTVTIIDNIKDFDYFTKLMFDLLEKNSLTHKVSSS
jgi:hypothetical protein